MDRSEFPHLNDSQFESVRKMTGIFGVEALHSLVSASQAEQVERIAAFDTYERGLIAHVRENMPQPAPVQVQVPVPVRVDRPKPLRLKVTPYSGKEGENLFFWVRETELAMEASLVSDERLRIAFALSNLSGRAKSWAYAREVTTPGCFTSWTQLCEQLRAAFLPANYEYRQRSRFLSCKQGKRELTEYIQEMRELCASLAGTSLPEHVKVTVFMDGLRIGPARTQLFRVQAKSLEEAVQLALQEEYSHRLARTPVSAWQGAPTNTGSRGHTNGPAPMDLSVAEQQHGVRCFACGKLGHMQRMCPMGGQRNRLPPRGSSLKGRWQKPRPRGQGNVQNQ